MSERPREYVRGVSSHGRPTLTLNCDVGDLPFGVWRDVGRLAGRSCSVDNKLTYEFLNPDSIGKAEDILKGALFTERKP